MSDPTPLEVRRAVQAYALRLQRDHAASGTVLLPPVTVSDLIVTLERAARAIPCP